MKRPGILFVLALAAFALVYPWLGTVPAFAQTEPTAPQTVPTAPQTVPTETPAHVPGQLIISFHATVTPEEVEAFYAEYGMVEMDDLDPNPNKESGEIRLAFVPVEVNTEVVDDLSRDPRVVYAEPNYVVQLQQTPNDPHYDRQWGHSNTGQTGGTAGADVGAPAGWQVTTGSTDVIMAVIDTGIDYNHEDLIPNLWVNPQECPQGYGNCVADGVDDDGSGYADDFYGVNTINDTGDPMDDFGHGTHVAGVMAARANNNLGIAGLNWEGRIVACKFLGASGGGTIAGAVKCFNYIRHLRNQMDLNVVLTNNSWGGGGYSQALEDAMAGPDQPLHIAAAGNGNTSSLHYPAGFDLPNLIAVASTDHNDQYSNFSNWGDWVHLAAPGSNIFSTVPTGQCPMCDSSGYAAASGTSMASPYVAGAIGLIAARYPELTQAQMIQRVINGVDMLPESNKSTQTNGRLNLFNSLDDDETPPAAISDLTPTLLLLTGVRLNWSAVGDDGMEGLASAYDLRYSSAPITAENWNQATRVPGVPAPQEPGAVETFTVNGLAPDTVYYFAIRALDNVGNESPISNVAMAKTIQGTVVFEDDVEDGPGDWTAAGTDDLWGISENRYNSPTHAWYYGDASKGNYDTGETNSGTLTSAPIDLVTNENVALVFYEWSEIEDTPTYDRTRVQVSTNGTSWETVYESLGTASAWERRMVDITPQVGESNVLHVRFWFDTVDNRFNDFEGWYVDDIAVLAGTPTVPGASTDAPNLLMDEANIGLSNPHPTLGETITVHAIVINNGVVEANNVQVQFMDGSVEPPTPIGPAQTIPNLPVGGNAGVELNYDTAAHADGDGGERIIQAVVDPYGLIVESNEADNSAARTFTVDAPPTANLVVNSANIGFNPAQPVPGDQVVIQAVIQNDSSVPVDDVTVQFMDVTDSDTTRLIGESQTINSIAAGGAAVAQVTYDTSGAKATRRIRVVIDPEHRIPESNESDNEAQTTLNLVTDPLPNLLMNTINVGFDPETPVAGADVTVLATVHNDGAVPASNVVVRFVDTTGGGSQIMGEAQVIDTIPAGGSGLAQIVYSTTGRAGDRRIRIEVDPQNLIEEVRDSDNETTVTLRVEPSPLPNLVMQSNNITLHPTQVVLGEPTTVRAVVLNTGNAGAEDVAVQFQDITNGAPVPLGDPQTIAQIGAGSGATVETTYETNPATSPEITGTPGERRIQVVVDPGSFITESNEQDNQATAGLTVQPPSRPNLTMLASNILFEPSRPVQGDVVTITAVVLNTGAEDATNVLVQFVDVTYSGFEPIGQEQTIDLVPKGGSATAQIAYDTRTLAGNRRIQILVDSNN
ncbi:MAG: S8 family serine peptidase, partial [Litorilinea sp.]